MLFSSSSFICLFRSPKFSSLRLYVSTEASSTTTRSEQFLFQPRRKRGRGNFWHPEAISLMDLSHNIMFHEKVCIYIVVLFSYFSLSWSKASVEALIICQKFLSVQLTYKPTDLKTSSSSLRARDSSARLVSSSLRCWTSISCFSSSSQWIR